MFNVKVFGWVPDKEIGEILYESFVYHVNFQSGKLRFVVYNPYRNEFDIVGESAVRPTALLTQDIPTQAKVRDYKKLLKEREKDEQTS